MNSLSRVFPLFQRKQGCIGEESVNKMNNLSIEMQDFMQNDILLFLLFRVHYLLTKGAFWIIITMYGQ